MGRIVLNVAEKPSAAREIVNILSQNARVSNRSVGRVATMEFESTHPQLGSVTMRFTSVRGHVCGLDFPDEYGWGRCESVEAFSAPVVETIAEDHRDIITTLQKECKDMDTLVIWTDCDREGEAIGFEIIGICQKERRSRPFHVLRARFSSFTPRDINRAFLNLVQPNKNEADAVAFRQEVDLRIGAAFTRWMTDHLQQKFPGLRREENGRRVIYSYGPCQFPTLGFVVERQHKIETFRPETFYSIDMKLDTVHFAWSRGRLFDRLTCFVLYDRCMRAPETVVQSVHKKQARKWRPLPLNTVEFQKLASRKLQMSGEDAMHVAEALYQKGILSYPRTETDLFVRDTISDDEIKTLVALQFESDQWGGYASGLVDGGKFIRPREGRSNDNAHPPIHPTKFTTDFENDNERKVYELVTRHFLACCSQDAIGSETVVQCIVADTETFSASGLIIEQRNFLEVYIYESWSNRVMPAFEQGQRFTPTNLLMTEGRTAPPPLLSEADLISTMDSNGIGTDATIASHIQQVQNRGYVTKNGTTFAATPLGKALVEAYREMDLTPLWKPFLRAKMESDMRLVAQGRLVKDVALAEAVRMYKAAFLSALQKEGVLDDVLARYFAIDHDAFVSSSLHRNCATCNRPYKTRLSKKNQFYISACAPGTNCPGKPFFFPETVKVLQVLPAGCSRCGARRLRICLDENRRHPFFPDHEKVFCLFCDRDVSDRLFGR
ncbi:mitochondrial DNA topoisomerase III [Andalucia godoyi]|uniref:DNA topoisomerase n=1 Tax=Andalucia godoyi TaxID=505711 RepID=A0A8K0AI32_ANDGO|nr:mitochondrial DNA topoisomerase III [Andalucia godoyi]WCZ58525.1 DNA topoisomerase 3-alpha [Andalucia godoyi]|eukprot:ANDGO_07030.mRNA.1 mitochondrial DNA topoisomerase III